MNEHNTDCSPAESHRFVPAGDGSCPCGATALSTDPDGCPFCGGQPGEPRVEDQLICQHCGSDRCAYVNDRFDLVCCVTNKVIRESPLR